MYYVQILNKNWKETDHPRYKWTDSIGYYAENPGALQSALSDMEKSAKLHNTPHRLIERHDVAISACDGKGIALRPQYWK